MRVKDFIKLDKAGTMYRVVDATKVGYMTNPTVLIEADRNVVVNRYGNQEMVGFEVAKKNTITIYVK